MAIAAVEDTEDSILDALTTATLAQEQTLNRSHAEVMKAEIDASGKLDNILFNQEEMARKVISLERGQQCLQHLWSDAVRREDELRTLIAKMINTRGAEERAELQKEGSSLTTVLASLYTLITPFKITHTAENEEFLLTSYRTC